jgi:hypothetical protein
MMALIVMYRNHAPARAIHCGRLPRHLMSHYRATAVSCWKYLDRSRAGAPNALPPFDAMLQLVKTTVQRC